MAALTGDLQVGSFMPTDLKRMEPPAGAAALPLSDAAAQLPPAASV